MPIGPYKNFDDCMKDMKSKGKNMDSAAKICGEIEKRTKKGESSKDWRKLNFNIPITEFISAENSTEFMIKGKAINETTTRNGVTYLAEELQPAAESFRDKPILKDHKNSVDSIVGRTTQNVYYNEMMKAIMFEAKVMDTMMQTMIKDGRIKNVSIGAMVKEIETKDITENGQTYTQMIARGIEGIEISLVAVPADKDACFAQAMMESFELKQIEELVKTTHTEEEKMDETVKSFGTKEEYTEYLSMKQTKQEEALKAQIEVKLREEMKKEMEVAQNVVKEDKTVGQVSENKNDTVLKMFENLNLSKDEYSQGYFITRK